MARQSLAALLQQARNTAFLAGRTLQTSAPSDTKARVIYNGANQRISRALQAADASHLLVLDALEQLGLALTQAFEMRDTDDFALLQNAYDAMGHAMVTECVCCFR